MKTVDIEVSFEVEICVWVDIDISVAVIGADEESGTLVTADIDAVVDVDNIDANSNVAVDAGRPFPVTDVELAILEGTGGGASALGGGFGVLFPKNGIAGGIGIGIDSFSVEELMTGKGT